MINTQFIFLEIAIIAAIIYGISLIIQIIRTPEKGNRAVRVILPLIGISILVFYAIRIFEQSGANF